MAQTHAIGLVLTLLTACGAEIRPGEDAPADPSDTNEPTAAEIQRVREECASKPQWRFVITPDGPECLPPKPEQPPTAEECTAAGGLAVVEADNEYARCMLPTSDAGKRCTDSDHCEGYCMADPIPAEEGIQAEGICSDKTHHACWQAVEDGITQPFYCY